MAVTASYGAPVIAWSMHHGGSRNHSNPITDFVAKTAVNVVNTGIDQGKKIVSGSVHLAAAAGEMTVSGVLYATGNKDLGAKLANDAAAEAKHAGNDSIDLLADSGNLYNKTQADLNDLVPDAHLGDVTGAVVSFTPIGPEVAAAQGFADIKNAYDNGGMKPAGEAAGYATIGVLPGAGGKGAKIARGVRAAAKGVEATEDLAKLAKMTKPAGTEAKVEANAAKPSKFLDHLETGTKIAKPAGFVGKGFIPGRDRDKDGKLQGSGANNWEKRRDAWIKLKKAKDQAGPPRAAQNPPAKARPRSVPGAAASRPREGALDSVEADEPVRNRDVDQAARDRAYNQERQRTEDEQRQADLSEKQRLENEQRQADLRDKERLADDKRQADIREKQTLENEQRQANIREKQRLENELRQADAKERQRIADQQRLADEKRRADQEEKQRIDNERIADQKRQAAEDENKRLADEKRRADQEEKQRLDNERIAEQKRQAQEEERDRLEAQRIAEQQREVEQEDKERLAEEKRQAVQQEKQRLADEQRRAQEEAAAARSNANQIQTTHSEDEEVQAQKEYLSKLRAPEQQNQQPKQKASPADEDQSGDDQNE